MNKFKVGERVAVYQCEKRWLDKVARMNGELLFFECLGGPFHEKQCRKLVKKKRSDILINTLRTIAEYKKWSQANSLEDELNNVIALARITLANYEKAQ